MLVWLNDGAARRLPAVDRRRVALFERTLGSDEQDLARARAELVRLAALFPEDHPAIVRTRIALARVHVNRGELEQAFRVLDDVRSDDPRAAGLVRYASQLGGCCRIGVGEVSDGIAQLERARLQIRHWSSGRYILRR